MIYPTTRTGKRLWQSSYGRVSMRMSHGEWLVRYESYETGQVIQSVFKTERGASICLGGYRDSML